MGNYKEDAVIADVTLDSNLQKVETKPPKYGKIKPTAPQSQPNRPSFTDMGASLVQENTMDSFDQEAGTASMTEGQLDKKLELGVGSFATGTDMEDALAADQGFGETMVKGTSGFVSRVALNTVGGLLSGAYGIGAMVTSGIGEDNEFDFTKLYQNEATDIYDSLDGMINESMGIHKSREFQNAGFLEKMASPGMFMDEFGNAVAFTVGAIATEYLSGGLASAAVGARMSKVFRATTLAKSAKIADATADAIKAQQLVGAAARSAKLKNSLTFARQTLVTGSAFEAGIETRHAMKELRTTLKGKGFSAEEIENTVASAEKWMFAGNLLITNVSNSAQFGGLFKGPLSFIGQPKVFSGAQKFLKKQGVRASNLVGGTSTFIKRSGKELATRKMGTKSMALIGLSRAAANPFAEGMEEASQSILQGGVNMHYGSKGSGQGEAYVSMMDGFMTSAKKQFTTKEGWNETLMGAMVGAMGRPMMKKGDTDNKSSLQNLSWTDSVWTNYKTAANDKASAETIVAEVNNHIQEYTGDKIKSAIKSGIDMESYLVEMHKSGDKADLMYDNFVMNYIKPFAKHGYSDIARANLDSFERMDGAEFAEAILGPNEFQAFVNGKTEQELTDFKDKQLGQIYKKMDNLESAYELAKTFEHFDSDMQELFAEHHYKVKSIPQMNASIKDALFTRFQSGFESRSQDVTLNNESDTVEAFENVKSLLSEMMFGNNVHTKDGKSVERTNSEVATELDAQLEQLINDGIINPADATELFNILTSDKAEVEGLTNGQAAAASLMHMLDATSAEDTVREMLMLNANDQSLATYTDMYNKLLADPAKYKALKDEKLVPLIERAINEADGQLNEISDEAYSKYIVTVKDNLSSIDASKYGDFINSMEEKLEAMDAKRAQFAAEAAAAKEEVAKIATEESLDHTGEENDSTIGSDVTSDAILDPHSQYKVDANAGITNRVNSKTGEMSDDGTRFDDFINDIKAEGLIPSFGKLKAELSFYTGDNPDSAKPGTSALDGQIPAMAEEEFEVFKMRFIDNANHPDKMHIRVHTTMDGTNLSYNTFMYTASGYANEQAMEDALKSLHNLIKVESAASKPSLKNIKVSYPYVNLTRGNFKYDKSPNGEKIYKDNPLGAGISTVHVNNKDQAAAIMENMVYSDSDGGVKELLSKAVAKSYVSLSMDNNGKVIKGQTFLKGVDQFGRPTLYKLNARRLNSKGAEAELEILRDIIEELMANPNPNSGVDANDGASKVILDKANSMLPNGIYKYDSLASLLSALVYHGDNTKGTDSSLVMFTKRKAMIVKGKTYEYNAEESVNRDTLIFNNLSDGGTVSLEYVMDQVGTLRQQISFSQMRGVDGDGKNDYAVHMINNIITTDITMDLKESSTEGAGYEFDSILENPQMYIRRKTYKAAEVESHDLAEEGIESMFTTEMLNKSLGTITKVTNEALEELTLKKALSNPNRYKVVVNNHGDDKIYIDNYPLPDGIKLLITGHDKGVLSYSFSTAKYGKFADYTEEDWDEVKTEIEDNIVNGPIKETHRMFIGKLKGVPSMTITDTKQKKDGKITIGSKQAESLTTTINNLITSRVGLFISKEGKRKTKDGKSIDTTYTQAIKAIFFPGKDHTKVKTKDVTAFIKNNPKEIQILNNILKLSAKYGFSRGRKGNNAVADIALSIFNNYSIGEDIKIEGNPFARKDSLKEGEQSYAEKAYEVIKDRSSEINLGLSAEQTEAFVGHIKSLASAIGNAQSFISKAEKLKSKQSSSEFDNIGGKKKGKKSGKTKKKKGKSIPGEKKLTPLELARIAKGEVVEDTDTKKKKKAKTTEELDVTELSADELFQGTDPDSDTSDFDFDSQIDSLIAAGGATSEDNWAPNPNADKAGKEKPVEKVSWNMDDMADDEADSEIEEEEESPKKPKAKAKPTKEVEIVIDALTTFTDKLPNITGDEALKSALSEYFDAVAGTADETLPLEIQFTPANKRRKTGSTLYVGDHVIKGIDAEAVFGESVIDDSGRVGETNLIKNNCK